MQHEIVPATLVDSIAGLKHGGTFKVLKVLLRHKLVHHDSSKYDGYRLTTLGYDFLAIKALVNRGAISSVGRQIGVGKESDVFEVADDEGRVMALKLHRLGRTSFRAVKSKRDYMRRGSHFSWLYLSRLAALKEFAFMKALGDRGLPVPEAIDCNRHAVLMSLIDAYPLVQVKSLENPESVYNNLMDLLCRLASLGLVHCDYNEFNVLIDEKEDLTLIDFPQMVSISHANAPELFDRDVDCIMRFFAKKLGFIGGSRPSFQLAQSDIEGCIDAELKASGFLNEHQEELDRYVVGVWGSTSHTDEENESEEDEDEDEGGAVSSSSECMVGDEEEGKEEEDYGSVPQIKTMKIQTPDSRAVAATLIEEKRLASRRVAIASASRNAAKLKNKGARKGAGHCIGID